MKKLIAALLATLLLASAATAAVTVSIEATGVFGNKQFRFVKITMDGSYPTGGESVTPTNLGLSGVELFLPVVDNAGIVFSYDYSAEKLMAFETGDTLDTHLNELNDTGVLTDVEVRALVLGY